MFLELGDKLRGRVVVLNVTEPFGLEGVGDAVVAVGLESVVVAPSLSLLSVCPVAAAAGEGRKTTGNDHQFFVVPVVEGGATKN